MGKKNIKEWAIVFRALGNPHRLHILQLLQKKSMTVMEITAALGISFKNTSRNLNILQGLGLVEAEGKKNHVFYSRSKRLKEEAAILRLTIW